MSKTLDKRKLTLRSESIRMTLLSIAYSVTLLATLSMTFAFVDIMACPAPLLRSSRYGRCQVTAFALAHHALLL